MNLKLAKAIVAIDKIDKLAKAPIFDSFPEYRAIINQSLTDIEAYLED